MYINNSSYIIWNEARDERGWRAERYQGGKCPALVKRMLGFSLRVGRCGWEKHFSRGQSIDNLVYVSSSHEQLFILKLSSTYRVGEYRYAIVPFVGLPMRPYPWTLCRRLIRRRRRVYDTLLGSEYWGNSNTTLPFLNPLRIRRNEMFGTYDETYIY